MLCGQLIQKKKKNYHPFFAAMLAVWTGLWNNVNVITCCCLLSLFQMFTFAH